jgi:putative addiction module component (TIGR02574 family)
MVNRETVLQQALSMPPDDRAYVATALEQSLSSDGPAASSEALLAELKRRSAAFRAGTTAARPAADVLADLRRRQVTELTDLDRDLFIALLNDTDIGPNESLKAAAQQHAEQIAHTRTRGPRDGGASAS